MLDAGKKYGIPYAYLVSNPATCLVHPSPRRRNLGTHTPFQETPLQKTPPSVTDHHKFAERGHKLIFPSLPCPRQLLINGCSRGHVEPFPAPKRFTQRELTTSRRPLGGLDSKGGLCSPRLHSLLWRGSEAPTPSALRSDLAGSPRPPRSPAGPPALRVAESLA